MTLNYQNELNHFFQILKIFNILIGTFESLYRFSKLYFTLNVETVYNCINRRRNLDSCLCYHPWWREKTFNSFLKREWEHTQPTLQRLIVMFLEEILWKIQNVCVWFAYKTHFLMQQVMGSMPNVLYINNMEQTTIINEPNSSIWPSLDYGI